MRLKIFAPSKYANYKSKFAERYCGLNLEKVQHVFSSDQDSRLTSEEVASHNWSKPHYVQALSKIFGFPNHLGC